MTCPKCGAESDRLVVEVEKIDWASSLYLGLGAILFPSLREKKLQCSSCGRTFAEKSHKAWGNGRIPGWVLLLILLLVVVVGSALFLFVARRLG